MIGWGNIFKKPVIYHALYWIFNVLFFTVIWWSRNDYKYFFLYLQENAAYLPGGMIFTYFSVYYLIPRFFFRNKILLYIFLQLLVLLLYPVVSNLVSAYFISPVLLGIEAKYLFYYGYLSIILILVFDIFPLAGVIVLSRFKKEAIARQKAELEKTATELKLREAELKLLKAQIHPHFLFNTLNNIYSLSLEKSEKTSDLLIRLADMLSYIIYDCNTERVSLAKEIEFIKSFIELQRIRYYNCDISLKIDVELNSLQIAPMILHTFVDNAFKHGADRDAKNPWIKISITSKNGFLFFSILNSTRDDEPESDKLTGIGIANVMKRLELIYPERHDLVINNSDRKYSVFLKLELLKHEQ
jgi:two-component system, LytTR family, sensor kinase